MSFKNRKNLLNKIKQQQSFVRKKEQSYDNRMTLPRNFREYNALEDPHASYYFLSKSVRNHLKSIKHATISETTHSLEKQRLKKLFNEKIKFKPKKFFSNQPGIHELEELMTQQANRKGSKTSQTHRNRPVRRLSENSKFLKNSLGQKGLSISEEFNQTSPLKIRQEADQSDREVFNKTEQKESLNGAKIIENEENKTIRKTRYEKLHQKKHRKFMSFIQQKKKMVLEFQKSIQSPQKSHLHD